MDNQPRAFVQNKKAFKRCEHPLLEEGLRTSKLHWASTDQNYIYGSSCKPLGKFLELIIP